MLLSQSNQPQGVQYAQAGEFTPEQLEEARRFIANAQNPHPGVGPGQGHDKDWVAPLLGEAYARGYAESMLGLASGPLGRGAPAAALAGKTAAERLAIRGLNFAFDPRAGFFRGAATGFGFGLSGFDSAGVEIPGNPAFQRGFAFGEAAGNLVGLIFR